MIWGKAMLATKSLSPADKGFLLECDLTSLIEEIVPPPLPRPIFFLRSERYSISLHLRTR